MAERKSYSEKLRDPRWQQMRLKVMERDGWECQRCGEKERTLAVHHVRYIKGREPWDYPPELLVTVCEDCHNEEYQNRPEEEAVLLDVLRDKKFWFSDVNGLAVAIYEAEFLHLPEVVVAAVAWVLRNPHAQKALLDAYFDHLKAKRLEAEAEGGGAGHA